MLGLRLRGQEKSSAVINELRPGAHLHWSPRAVSASSCSSRPRLLLCQLRAGGKVCRGEVETGRGRCRRTSGPEDGRGRAIGAGRPGLQITLSNAENVFKMEPMQENSSRAKNLNVIFISELNQRAADEATEELMLHNELVLVVILTSARLQTCLRFRRAGGLCA